MPRKDGNIHTPRSNTKENTLLCRMNGSQQPVDQMTLIQLLEAQETQVISDPKGHDLVLVHLIAGTIVGAGIGAIPLGGGPLAGHRHSGVQEAKTLTPAK